MRTLVGRFARHALVLASTAVIFAGATGAAAQVSPGAVEAFLTDARLMGAGRATVGRVNEEGGAIVANDVSIEWRVTFDETLPEPAARAVLTLPRVTIEGLSSRGDGHAAERITIPTLQFSLHNNEEQPDGEEREVMTLALRGTAFQNARWGAAPQIAADPARPVSRFAPLIDWLVALSYDEAAVELFDMSIETPDGAQEVRYGPLVVGPVTSGRIEEFRYGPLTVEQEVEVESLAGRRETIPMTVKYGEIVVTALDLSGLAALLTGTGASESGATTTVIGDASLGGIEMSGASPFGMSMGEVTIESMTVDSARGPLLAKLDPVVRAALANETPSAEVLTSLLLDAYAAFGFARYAIEDIAIRGPEFTGALDAVVMEGLSAAGLERLRVADLEMIGADGRANLEALDVEGVAFPDAEAIIALVALGELGIEPTASQVLAAMPTLDTLRVDDLSFAAAEAGALGVDLFELSLGGHVNAIPTRAALTLSRLEVPPASLPASQMKAMLTALGVDPLRLDGDVALAFDPASERLTLDHEVSAEGAGRLTARGAVAGVPARLLEDFDASPALLGLLQVEEVALRFEDDGLTAFVLGMMAQQSGISAAELAAGLAAQANFQIGTMLAAPALGAQVAATIETFLTDPQSLSISVRPPTPVAVAQLIGAAMAAPQRLPQLLNLSIAANE